MSIRSTLIFLGVLAVAVIVTFGLMSLVIALLGQNKLGWVLMGLAWVLAHLGEFKDIANSPSGVFEGGS